MPKHLSPPDSFRVKVEELVHKFDANKEYFLSPQYSESQARIDFIDPLFEALGWRISLQHSENPRERDVIVERGQTTGRPDYNFRVEGKTKIFVEAKAPHVSIARGDVILQAKKYAWNNIDEFVYFAAVTDFQEFHLYDASRKPDPKHPETGLIFAYTYDHYLTDKALSDLWQLSRDSVIGGSLDKLISASARAARQRVPLDRQFLADLTKWREQLAKSVFKTSPHLTPADLNSVVQVLLDRLIFIRIGEDRGALPPNRLRDITSKWKTEGKQRPITADLILLFRDVNNDLNGEIFKEHPADKIKWDSALIAAIVDDGLEPYNFSQIGVELLGSIYERYLGKTIRVTATRAIVEDKPEVRQAHGVYYTPNYVVNYIVENTVGELIKGKSPTQIAKIKIIDPACGSGSFLLGAYQCLLDYNLKWHDDHAPKQVSEQRALYGADEGGKRKLSLEEKSHILQNNIFGIDLDPQAVEITMMSLYIKMLEGERGLPTKQALLPKLASNIKCGNSLISRSIYEQLGLFEENGDRIRPFDWEDKRDGFGEVMQTGGFDVVIGNPPYGASFGDKEYAYFRETYKVFRGVKDVYTCFMEAALGKLKKGGMFSFIVPSAWLGGPEYQPLREVIAQNEIDKVILLPYDIFTDAYVDTTIFVLSKRRPDVQHSVQTFAFGKRDKIEKIDLALEEYRRVKQADWGKSNDKKFVLDPSTIKLLEVIQQRTSLTFDDVIQIKRGVLFKSDLLTAKKTSATSYRYFEGDVYRYAVNYETKHWIEFDDKMSERPKEFIWFEGQRILLRRLVNRRQRLMASLVNDTFVTNKNLYSILPKGKGIDLRVVLGIINSTLISYLYINRVTQASKDDFPQVTIKDILALPYPELQKQKELQEKLVQLVDLQLGLHQQRGETSSPASLTRIESDIRSFDARIDKLVYELYGLTEDEIKIVESK